MSKAFGHQIRLRIAARAIGAEYDTLRKWRQRFGLFGTPGEPKRELSVPEVCGLRVAVIALHRCRGISVREALEFAALAVPGFEDILRGERATETIEFGNIAAPRRTLELSLGGVLADVLPKLGLGFVSRGFGHVTPNQTAGVLP
jgi:hypothetical protein